MKRPISARCSSAAGGDQRIGGVTTPSCQAVPRTVTATRYVTPLREGGSLPGLVEADDDGMYVCKFRGAGQGPKALVAEVVAAEDAGKVEVQGSPARPLPRAAAAAGARRGAALHRPQRPRPRLYL